MYKIKIQKKWVTFIPVDGEEYFNQPGKSCGFIHFMDPETKKCLGFCGVSYFEKHAIKC